ncbi:esterase FE4-like [Phymastichus coffea]|uniref:esterase FE4-like n=1 Tax=Phymastichus coffea TaxID=108790 RepID=UPI00273B009B|nr:esterase FE4-like [Phymastichus coffea]
MERPIISISDGKIQGITRESVLGKKYLAFTGIPYAQPPLGHLRFKEPQIPAKWSGILDASKRTNDMATQYQTSGPRPWKVIGNEDCLYLNVYTNAIAHKRPVMFYIHGGGFVEGSGNHWIYGEDYFVTMDLLLVSVNYRLGPLGFMNLGHKVAPGNQGLRDILYALKWVQQNIEAFGGDPENVTIFGNSSGSVASHLLTLLPAAKGLFHKAILQSGTAFGLRHLLKENTKKPFLNGFKIATLFGCDSDDPIEVVEFLRSVPAEKLVSVEHHLSTKWENVILGRCDYGPVIDARFCEDPLIPAPLGQLLQNDTNIPIIIGNTINEDLLGFAGLCEDEEHFSFYDDHIDNIIRNSLMLNNSGETDKIIEHIKEYYLKNQRISPKTVWNLINLLTHLTVNFDRKVIDLRNGHAKAPTYVYRFSYCGNEPTFYSYDEGPQPVKGVAHADELSYMFHISYMKADGTFTKCPEEGSADRMTLERFVRMWFNFAATGNPTPKTDSHYVTTIWKPTTPEHLYYLDIGDHLVLKDDRDSPDWIIYKQFRKNYLGLNL